MLKGIDISEHNWTTPINFPKVKAAGIDFAIIRLGLGTSTLDKKFIDNVNGCLNAGIMVKGVYHFSYALAQRDAIQEARFAVSQMPIVGLGKDIPIFFDFEYDTLRYAKDLGRILGPADANAHALAFCDEIEASGYPVGIYFNSDFYNNWYDHNLLAQYINWVADYNIHYNATTFPYRFRQYTDKGNVDGITGDVDMDLFFQEDPIIETEEKAMTIDITDAQLDELIDRMNRRLASRIEDGYAKEANDKTVKIGIFGDSNKDGILDGPQCFVRRQELSIVLDRIGILTWLLAVKK